MWPSTEAISILRDRARGLFIYAATVIKFVANEFLGRIVPAEQYVTPFADIDKLYPSSVGKLTFIRRAVKREGIASGTASSALKFLRSLIVVPKSSAEPVHIIHPSFQDFFGRFRCWDCRFALVAPLHHEQLAERYFFQVMISLLKQNICNLNDTNELNKDVENLAAFRLKFIPAHLIYACSYCGSPLSLSLEHL
ncbi:hypothetical protein F5050DRAFT_423506 [Lentinula boryana]|uniref:Uncharacterized protein n=1 Tax=Lentinula boryana TaxID=40481 RepID=A0ABQ8Q8K3_9AGAR|nr:hypothetical protein F5050DRAFT_423506 [Lentinula boryana]